MLALIPLWPKAVIAMVFTPALNGIGPVPQAAVPVACPAPPLKFNQFTRAMPELSEAVPKKDTVALAVV